jgi:excinuclease ABC subunit B
VAKAGSGKISSAGMARAELAQLIQDLNEQMLAAARELQFELAARIRDEVAELKKELRAMDVAGVR